MDLCRHENYRLVSPVDPNFRSAMLIGGACVGALVMILTRRVTLTEDVLDGAMSGDIKYQVAALFILASPIAVGGFSGYESAALLVECHAFYGTQPSVLQQVFFVEKHTVNRKGPDWLYLRQTSIPDRIPISCGYKSCRTVEVGDRLQLQVESGRDGVQRVSLPMNLVDTLIREKNPVPAHGG